MQRPQQLLRALARLGITVYYTVPRQSINRFPSNTPNLILTAELPWYLKLKQSVVFYFTYPPHIFLARKYPQALVVFDSIDLPIEEFRGWGTFYREALGGADLVLASSQKLLKQALDVNPNSILIPNGCDFEFFAPAREHLLPPPPELKDLPRPIIGYFGSISSWCDLDLVREVAVGYPSASVVMIGPVVGQPSLPQCKNLHWIGYRPYESIPAYAQMFDVAIIPFRISNMTEAVNPVKMWEYLAAGLPVVSTALPEARDLEGVYWSANDKDFIKNIDKALRDENKEARLRLARENTWLSRAMVISNQVEILLPARLNPEKLLPAAPVITRKIANNISLNAVVSSPKENKALPPSLYQPSLTIKTRHPRIVSLKHTNPESSFAIL